MACLHPASTYSPRRRTFSPRWAIGAVCLLPLLLGGVPLAKAETHALMLVGLPGEQRQWEDFQVEQAAWEKALTAHGITGERLKTVISAQANAAPGDTAFRTEALAALEQWKTGLTEEDDALLVVIGHGSTRNGSYTFQNRGPRLRGQDFAVLKDLPVRTLTAVISGPGGIGLAEALRGEKRNIICATAVETEINLTRFGPFFAQALAEDPQASLATVFEGAAQKVSAFYTSEGRAQTEHSTLFLGAAQPLEPPLELAEEDPLKFKLAAWTLDNLSMRAGLARDPAAALAAATPEPPPSALGSAERDLKDLGKLPVAWKLLKDAAEIDEVPYLTFRDATPEEMALFKDVPAPTEYPEAGGIMLSRTVRLEVKDRNASAESTHTRLYVRDLRIRPLLDQMYSPPMNGFANIRYLKTISPNGKVIEVQPDALAAFCRACGGDVMLFAPGVEPGVIVESEIESASPPPQYQAFNREVPITHSLVPTRDFKFVLTTPKKDSVQFKVYGDQPATAEETAEEYSHRWTWNFKELPAAPLPEAGAPPDLNALPRIAISSYKKWDDFVGWYQHLMRDVRNSSEMLKAKAGQLAEGKTTEDEKIRAVYEYVNNLRYMTIVGGANSWRPRNPTTSLARQYGDCKDKANLIVALLHEMGIEGQFALVARGTAFDKDFPNFGFNHAIAVIPRGEGPEDDIWLDATDSSTPYGMMPPGDPGRWAMVMTGEGAADYRWAQIPAYNKGFTVKSKVTLTLSAYDAETGRAEAEFRYAPEGIEAYQWSDTLRGAEPVQVRQILARKLIDLWPGAQVKEVAILTGAGTASPEALPSFSAKLSLALGAPGEVRLPRPFWEFDKQLAAAAWDRSQPLELNQGYPHTFVQELVLPAGVELPGLTKSSSNGDGQAEGIDVFLKTNCVTSQENGAWQVVSTLEIIEPVLPAEKLTGALALTRHWTESTSQIATTKLAATRP